MPVCMKNMKIKCELVFEYENAETASKILKAVEIDNHGFVNAKIMENQIISHIEASTLMSLLHTLDDYLACVSVAEKIVERNSE